jgi:cytosine/adenosine deaminase-related metal-dependent hydrolase
MFGAAGELAAEYGLLMHTHGSETQEEVQEARLLHCEPPIAHLHDLGLLSGSLVIAHAVWLTPEEEDLARVYGVGLVHCPSSNLKLGSGIAPAARWDMEGIRFGIAADGAPCNNFLDGFAELHLASLLAKPRFGAAALAAESAFGHATIEGAKVLGWEEEIGSLEVGKQADIVLLDMGGLHHQPHGVSPIYSQLVYQTKSSDVCMTMIAGRIVYDHGKFPSMDISQIKRQAQEALIHTGQKMETLGYLAPSKG